MNWRPLVRLKEPPGLISQLQMVARLDQIRASNGCSIECGRVWHTFRNSLKSAVNREMARYVLAMGTGQKAGGRVQVEDAHLLRNRPCRHCGSQHTPRAA